MYGGYVETYPKEQTDRMCQLPLVTIQLENEQCYIFEEKINTSIYG